MEKPVMRTLACALVLATLVSSLSAQSSGRSNVPGSGGLPRPGMGPGQGPTDPFLAEDWHYWWFLNQEATLRLREKLHGAPDFLRITRDDRARAKAVLQELLRDKNAGLRSAAIIALAKSGDADVLELVQRGLKDPVESVRRETVLALGVLGVPDSLLTLRELLTSSSGQEMRLNAGVAMGLIGGPQARALLRSLLIPERYARLDASAQSGLALGAGLSADRELGGAVLELALRGRSISNFARAYLVLALGRIADPAHKQILIELLDDDKSHVRQAAALALSSMLKGSGDSDAIEGLQQKLQPRGKSGEGQSVLRNFLSIALGQIGGPQAASVLHQELVGHASQGRRVVGLLRSPLSEVSAQPFTALALTLTGHQNPAIQRLIRQRFLKEGSRKVQAAFALALGLYGDSTAVAELRKELHKSRDAFLRTYLALAVGLLEDQGASHLLATILTKDNDRELLVHSAIGLALMGETQLAQETITKRLRKRGSQEVQQSLLYGLALVGDYTAVEPVFQTLKDSRATDEVRRYAAIALGDFLERAWLRDLARLTTDFNYNTEPHLLRTLLATL
jgi:HEAT repeat protein